MSTFLRVAVVRVAVVPVAVLALAACSGGSSPSSSSTPASSSTSASAPGRGGFGGVDFAAVQSCLKAAGVSVPTPSGGFPSTRPSFTGPPPTDRPRPSGTGGFGGPGRGGGMFRSKEVQAALKACGITIPTGRPRTTPTAGA